MNLLALLILSFSAATNCFTPPYSVPVNTSWKFTDSAANDGIILYQSSLDSPGIGAGFSRVQCKKCAGFNIFFSVYLLGPTPGSVGEIGNGPASRSGRIIWIANSNRPVLTFCSLELESSGNLVLRDLGGSVAWESNTAGKGVMGMELQDSGNLVLYDVKNRTVWQSFDMVTDTLIVNQRLQVGQSLQSRVSEYNMSDHGHFRLIVQPFYVSLEFRTGGSYGNWCAAANKRRIAFVTFNNDSLSCHGEDGSTIKASLSGVNKVFQLLPSGDLRAFTLEVDLESDEGLSVMPSFTAEFSPCGKSPGACGEYGVCTASAECTCPSSYSTYVDVNGPKQGCKLNRPPVNCNNTELVEFPGMRPIGYLYSDRMTELSLDECKNSCLTNCDCKGAVFLTVGCLQMLDVMTVWNYTSKYNDDNSTMFLKMSLAKPAPKLPDIRTPDIPTPTSPGIPTPTSTGTSGGRRRKPRFTVYIVGGIVLGAVIVIALAVWKFYNAKAFARPPKQIEEKTGSNGESFIEFRKAPVHFTYRELCEMTENFRVKLGQGGFSTVYAGALQDGSKVAVKKLESARQGLKQFKAEVVTIGNIHHRNLVRLQGYGTESNHYYLVYEFHERLSLDKWLFDSGKSEVLSWKQRCSIAIGIAQGLDYLHGGCKDQVLHLDIKPQNILLDAVFEAKICDFGLARLVDRSDGDNFINTVMRGTPGYMAPEWLHSRVTDKTDVYSFGIVLLEIVSGKKTLPLPSSMVLSQGEEAKIAKTRAFEKCDLLEQVVDPRLLLMADFDMNQAKQLVSIGLLCVHQEQLQRPTMKTALKLLEDLLIPNDAAACESPAPP